MNGQLKLPQKVVDLVDRANREICVTLVRHSVHKPESFYAPVPFFARENEDEKFQYIVNVKNKLEESINLLYVMNSVYDKVLGDKPVFNVL